jgi:hypothetical protein
MTCAWNITIIQGSWLNGEMSERDHQLLAYTTRLMHRRHDHPVLHLPKEQL